MKGKGGCEALKDVPTHTPLTVKRVRHWNSLPQLRSLFYLPVSCHWVPQTLVLMGCVYLALPSARFRASSDVVRSKLGFQRGAPGPVLRLSLTRPELQLMDL